MTTLHYEQDAPAINQLLALLNELPAGCDPEFDNDGEELERQFAELRLTLAHHYEATTGRRDRRSV